MAAFGRPLRWRSGPGFREPSQQAVSALAGVNPWRIILWTGRRPCRGGRVPAALTRICQAVPARSPGAGAEAPGPRARGQANDLPLSTTGRVYRSAAAPPQGLRGPTIFSNTGQQDRRNRRTADGFDTRSGASAVPTRPALEKIVSPTAERAFGAALTRQSAQSI